MHTFVHSLTFNVDTVAATFMDTIQNIHGNVKNIVSDRDMIFIGKFWIELFSWLGT